MPKTPKTPRPSRPYFYAIIILTFIQALLLQYVVESYFGQHDARIPWISGASLLLSGLMIFLYKKWAEKEKSARQRGKEL
ncbi:hypothetical protein [Aneurinibacillus sp. REN35]|uniref:hypothetical protein n=1 Tax=Aneurinibacillus sp. REN35 TaxID=3237286 RepID=UPI0035288023